MIWPQLAIRFVCIGGFAMFACSCPDYVICTLAMLTEAGIVLTVYVCVSVCLCVCLFPALRTQHKLESTLRERNRTCSKVTQATQEVANGMAGTCHVIGCVPYVA